MPRVTPFGDKLWTIDGPTVPFFGVPYSTRMAIAELPDGLWLWSPVELDDALEAEVRELGQVRWIVSPNKIHHLFIGPWLEAFEGAQLFEPPGLAARCDLSFDGPLTDQPNPAWAAHIDQVVMHGSPVMEEVLFFHRASSTCLVGDLIQRHDPDAFNRWQRAIMQLDGMVGPDGSTPREWRATFIHRDEARRSLERVLAWKPERLLVAHGQCATERGAEVLEAGLHWMTQPWPV